MNNYKPSQEQQQVGEVAELLRQGKTYKNIASILNISYSRVYQLACKAKVAGLYEGRRNSEKQRQRLHEVVELLRQEKAYKDIASILNVSRGSVGQLVYKARVEGLYEGRKPKPSKERQRIGEVTELFKQDKSYDDVAKALNISRSYVALIARRAKEEGLYDGRKPSKKRQQQRLHKIVELLKQGQSCSDVAKALNISDSYVYQLARRAKEEGLYEGRRNSEKQRQRLHEIAELLRKETSRQDIATMLNTTSNYVSKLARKAKEKGFI